MTIAGLTVPYVDLVLQHSRIKAELMAAIGEVLDGGRFILGEYVETFERRFAALCGVPYAVGVSSGTEALVLALRVLGIGPGDEVIAVPNSFVASTACIRLVGARPVFVDVDDDYNLDPALLERAVTPRTKAVLPVHLTGRPCRMDAILEISARHGLPVVEDAAQAVAAEYRGRRVGSFGAVGCFSMHPLKTLNACGDAGVLTTDDPRLYERLMVMRNIGLQTRDDCVVWASNSRLDALQAAILLVKLRYLDEWTEQRRRHARMYQQRLADVPQVAVPAEDPDIRAVYHTFVIQADERDALRTYLAGRGIGSAVHYPVPIHLSTAGRELGYGPGSFPVAERQAERVLSLPIHQDLMPEQIDAVCGAIREFYARRG